MADISSITIPVKNSSTGVIVNQTYNLKSENVDLFVDCSTARSTAAKKVTITGFSLKTGAHIFVRFTDTGTSNPSSGNLTLEVNSTGAKTIVDGHTNNTALTYSSGFLFYNNTVAEFIYDGTYWVYINRDNDSTTGDNIRTNVAKTGSAQSSVVGTIAKSTTMDDAIGTLLNNDQTLEILKANVQLAAGSGDQTFSVSGLTSKHVLIDYVLGYPEYLVSVLEWDTDTDGQLVLNGTVISIGTSITCYFAIGR